MHVQFLSLVVKGDNPKVYISATIAVKTGPLLYAPLSLNYMANVHSVTNLSFRVLPHGEVIGEVKLKHIVEVHQGPCYSNCQYSIEFVLLNP